jgi:hypothetical protein
MAKNPLFSAKYKHAAQKKKLTLFSVWYEFTVQGNSRQYLFYATKTIVVGKTEL